MRQLLLVTLCVCVLTPSIPRAKEQEDLKKQLEVERLEKLRILREKNELKKQMTNDKKAQLQVVESSLTVRTSPLPFMLAAYMYCRRKRLP